MTPLYKFTYYESNDLYIKRDDLLPFSFGGNKARKAGYFFREIDAGHYDCVVTYGSSSSNHCRVVSNMTASRSIPCYIISPSEASDPTFNSQMMGLFGAEITTVPVDMVHDTIEAKMAQLTAAGKHPYFIPGGGHGNLGTQAYVDCYEEICQYEQEQGVHFDYIFLASGTGTTQAGLVCGQLMHRDNDRQIIGISIARRNPRGRQVVLDSIHEYLSDKQAVVSDAEIDEATVFCDDYIGDGYGKDNTDIQNTIQEVLTNYGIPLDATYTGKSYMGMKQYVAQKQIKGASILFIHTGGTPLFFDGLRPADKRQ